MFRLNFIFFLGLYFFVVSIFRPECPSLPKKQSSLYENSHIGNFCLTVDKASADIAATDKNGSGHGCVRTN